VPGAVQVVTEYKDLLTRTETLIREFQPSLSAGAVIGTVVSCRHELRRTGVRRGLAIAAEAMARSRLRGSTTTAGGHLAERSG
jgi:hypothetical protein